MVALLDATAFFVHEGVKVSAPRSDAKPALFQSAIGAKSSVSGRKNIIIFKVLICKGVKLCYYNKDYVILLVKANTAWRM